MKTLKKIEVISAGYICALFCLLVGFILAIISLIGFYNPELRAEMYESTVVLLSYFEYFILIILPMFYASLGFILSVITASVYNLFTKSLWRDKIRIKLNFSN